MTVPLSLSLAIPDNHVIPWRGVGLCLCTLQDTHWHCSPTRRSFLTGRLPVHHHEQLSGVSTDDIDLRWTWVSAKLKSAGYSCFW